MTDPTGAGRRVQYARDRVPGDPEPEAPPGSYTRLQVGALGTLHGWAQYTRGDRAYSVAIVEEDDGRVFEVRASAIRFVDR